MLFGLRALLLLAVLLAGCVPRTLAQDDKPDDRDKAARISFEFPVYEVWEHQGPVRLRLKANRPLSMQGEENVFIKPLEIIPVSARDRNDFSDDPLKVTFEAGSVLSSYVGIDIVDDSIMEENETFICVILKSTQFEKDDLLTEDPDVATIAILDSDTVVVHFERSEYFGREVADSESKVEYAVVAEGQFEVNFTVTVETEDATAKGGPGLDYATQSTELLFLPNMARLVATTIIYNDKMLEGPETYNLTLHILQSISNVVVSEPSEALVHIEDNDEVTVAFERDFYPVNEEDSVVELTVIITGAVIDSPVSLRVLTSELNPLSAADDEDFGTTDVLVQFDVGRTPMTHKVTVPILEDNILELAERFAVSLEVTNQTTSGVKLGTPSTATVEITDNDAVVVTFADSRAAVEESAGMVSLLLVATGAEVGTTFTVQVDPSEAVPPSARGDVDFVTTTRNVTFTPENPLVVADIVIFEDSILEMDEDFVAHLVITNGTLDGRVTAGNTTDVVVTILDDEVVILGFATESEDVFENEGVVVLPLVLTGGTLDEPFTVRVELMEKTAEEVLDFTASSGEIVIQPNTTQYDLKVEIIDDAIREETEEFEVGISTSGTGSAVTVITMGIKTARIAIIDDDTVSVEFIESMMTVVEAERRLSVCLIKRGTTTLDAEVAVTTCDRTEAGLQLARENGSPGPFGGDYDALQLKVLFPPQKAESCVEVSITDDVVVEGLEVFGLCLEELDPTVTVGTVNTTTITIIDDDRVTVEFDRTLLTTREDILTLSVCLVKTGNTTIENSADVIACNRSLPNHLPAVDGADYSRSSIVQTITFAPEESRKCFVVGIIDDKVVEGSEAFEACVRTESFSVEIGSNDSVTVVIMDNDDVRFDMAKQFVSVTEGDRPSVDICVNLTGLSAVTSSVRLTLCEDAPEPSSGLQQATVDQDFSFSATLLTFQPGEERLCAHANITDDSLGELDEEFHVCLERVDVFTVIGQPNTTITIVDNDIVVVSFVEPVITTRENQSSTSLCVIKTGRHNFDVAVSVEICSNQSSPVSMPGLRPATQGFDFEFSPVLLVFGNQAIHQCASISIVDDFLEEESEYVNFCLRIDNPRTVFGLHNSATVVIKDNDRFDVDLGDVVTYQNVTTVTVIVTLTDDSITSTVNVTIVKVTVPGGGIITTTPKVTMVPRPSTVVNLNFTIPTESLPTNATVSVRLDTNSSTTVKNITVTITLPPTVTSQPIVQSITGPSQSIQHTDYTAPSGSVYPTDSSSPSKSVQPTDSLGSSKSVQPTDSLGPSKSVQPTDSPRPSKSVQPTDSPRPSKSVQPTDSLGPSKSVQPTDSPRPSKSVQPTNSLGPSKPVQPTDSLGPSKPVQPTDSLGPSKPVQPTDSLGPSKSVQPTDSLGPSKSVQPTDSPSPSKPVQTTEDPGPSRSVQSIEGPHPSAPVQPTDLTGILSSVHPISSTTMETLATPAPSESTLASVVRTSVAPSPQPSRSSLPLHPSSISGPPPMPTADVAVVFKQPRYIVDEGDDVDVCITRQGTLSDILSFTLVTCLGSRSTVVTACGDADENDDYRLVRTTVMFDSEQEESCVTLEAVNDIITEGAETFDLCLEEYSVSTTVVIRDNDAVQVEFARTEEVRVHESQASFNVCLVKRGENSCPVTALVATCSGLSGLPAAAGEVDYRSLTLAVTFESAEHLKCFSDIIVLDDSDIEPDEAFGVCLSSNTSTVTIPKDPNITVVIQNDDVRVEFVKDRYTLETADTSTATVCLTKTEGAVDFHVTVEARPEEITSEDFNLGDGEELAKVDIHFSSRPITVTFAPDEGEKCVGIDILVEEDSVNDFVFLVTLVPERPMGVMNATILVGDDTTVVITEATFTGKTFEQKLVLSCTVENPLIVTTFHVNSPNATHFPSYSFMGPCEYELVRICDRSMPFRVHVNFLSQDLNSGRVGIVLGSMGTDGASLGHVIVFENLTVEYEHLEEPVVVTTDEGTRSNFNRSRLVVMRSAEAVKVDVLAFDISIQLTKVPESESLVVNVTVSEDLLQLCGLCGDTAGELVFKDSDMLVDVADPEQVKAFIQSWRVPADMQFLREQSVECGSTGIMRNDTVIGDPLFAVPLLVGDNAPELNGLSLCYEIHGESNRYFNFISDTCTSVNALYSPMIGSSHGNIVSKVGIVAVGSSNGSCVKVAVDLDGCTASLNGESVERTRSEAGVTVLRHRNRVRIGAPNCENTDLIMWIVCQNISAQPMIKFMVSRGYNLKPTSHGLLGQFWNIPVTVSSYEPPASATPEQRQAIRQHRPYVITVTYPGADIRSFTAYLYHRAWDKTASLCLYGGNSQGGPWSELPGPNDPLIEGSYRDYITQDLFDASYRFSRFRGTCPP